MDLKVFCALVLHRLPVKTLVLMKMWTITLLVISLQLSARSFSQNISLSFHNASLETIFHAIEQQVPYHFVYTSEELDKTSPVTINVKSETIEKIMEICLKEQPLTYRIESDYITIRSKGFTNIADTLLQVKGIVMNENGKPLVGISVAVKETNKAVATNELGVFLLRGVKPDATLVFSSVGYERQEVKLDGQEDLRITLKISSLQLGNVEIVYSSGYQDISKERATGSFDFIDNTLINRSVSTDVLSKLDGVASGVLFNTNSVGNNNAPISIRGRSTIFSNPNPLIVLDNFPYLGDYNNINPNDIESITILKDAAAASIWGVQAGNGVIVINTKHGHLNQSPKVSFNSNLTIGGKPNLWATPQMSSSDFIGVEEYLYNQGNYSVYLQYLQTSPQSPVIDLLDSAANGLISQTYADNQINLLKNQDIRYQQSKYFYRPSVNQQYAINIQGGGQTNDYFFSAGYDNNLLNQVGSTYERFTINGNNNYHLFKDRVVLSTGILFTDSKTSSIAYGYAPKYPYEQIAGPDGQALPVYHDYRKSFIDTAGEGYLLDWTYRPLDERNSNSITNLIDYKINLGLTFRILPYLKLTGSFQYERGISDNTTDNSVNLYYARNLINIYSQPNFPSVTFPIPVGDIVQYADNDFSSKFGRIQLNLDKTINVRHGIKAIAGGEINDYNSFSNIYQVYGYNPETATNVQVDYLTSFSYYDQSTSNRIPDITGENGITNRNISYYASGSYTYLSKYTFYLSGRKDESNLFGVSENQKGVPLGSAGMMWDLAKEGFYHLEYFPYLKLRISDGFNGNVNRNLSAYTTAEVNGFLNTFNAVNSQIQNPPNSSLRWEKVHIINFGLDFSTRNNTIGGSVDYYLKYGLDLIGNSPISAQTGITQFTGNNSNTSTKGVDITINTTNFSGKFKWYTNFLFSYVTDIITSYKAIQGSNSDYVTQNYTNPLQGKPYEAMFSYKWAGLDSAGNPMGYLNGKVSEDYSSIENSTNVGELVYSGSATPLIFGSLRNTFSYKNVEVSFNLKYKLKYFIRKGGLNYLTLFNGTYQQPDFEKRWQKPGDEKITNVPSMIYPDNPERDIFYLGSTALIDKADQFRFQDIRISYTCFQKKNKSFPISDLQFYIYVNNLGIIWRANKDHLDPDYVSNGVFTMPNPRTIAFGVKANL